MANRTQDPAALGTSSVAPGRGCAALAVLLLSAGCYSGVDASHSAIGTDSGGEEEAGEAGEADGTGADTSVPPDEDLPDDAATLGPSPLRRLSLAEYQATVLELTGVDVGPELGLLPADPRTPFDNDALEQFASSGLIEGLHLAATHVAQTVTADPELRSQVLGCDPTGPDDEACLRAFTERFLFGAYRRPPSDEEVERYLLSASVAQDQQDFDAAVEIIIAAALQDPSMVYRIEIGKPVTDRPGVRALDEWELASRLSYFLYGSMPDPQLFAAAEAGELGTAEELGIAAARMLDTDRGRARVQRFHAQWLGYESLPHTASLGEAMRAETAALITDIVFESQDSWFALLSAGRTWVTPELAAHYGMQEPADPRWVEYQDPQRAGILSHGTVLSNGAKFGDTSPVQRGLFVQRRLLCREIPLPDLDDVDTDAPPPATSPDECKLAGYERHREDPTCAACHAHLDPIGFGLEAFDAAGRKRLHEPDRPECPIDGIGELAGIGSFSGPAELGEHLQVSPDLEDCLVRHTYRFAVGRDETDIETPTIEGLKAQTRDEGWRFDALLLAIVESPSFRYRVEGEMGE